MKRDSFLERLEARLQVKLPRIFRERLMRGGALSSDRYEIDPERMHRGADSEWEGARGIPGIVIGHDVGGNPLILQFEKDSSVQLAERVWTWNHDSEEGGELSPLADALDDLLRPGPVTRLEAQASRILAEDAKKKPAAKTVATPLTPEEIAPLFVDRLLSAGLLEIEAGGRARVDAVTLEALRSIEPIESLLHVWNRCDAVVEVFASDEELTLLLALLRRPRT